MNKEGCICPETSGGVIHNWDCPNNELNPKNRIQPYLQGWVCPKCGSVMSPFQSHCVKCFKYDYTYSIPLSTSGSVSSTTG